MSARTQNPSLPPRKVLLRVAAAANVDPRTVHAFLTGAKSTTPVVGDAINVALRSLGLPEVRR